MPAECLHIDVRHNKILYTTDVRVTIIPASQQLIIVAIPRQVSQYHATMIMPIVNTFIRVLHSFKLDEIVGRLVLPEI